MDKHNLHGIGSSCEMWALQPYLRNADFSAGGTVRECAFLSAATDVMSSTHLVIGKERTRRSGLAEDKRHLGREAGQEPFV